MKRLPTIIEAGLLLALVLASPAGRALTSDRDQPMLIEADRAELDDARGISTYRGNVKVTQGTLVLTGDTMTVYSKDDEITKVIVEGTPASYRQRPDGKDEDVHARSRRMEYYRDPERVVLIDNAEVTQAGDVLRSDRILYDVGRDKVEAGGTNSGQRVRITLQPKPKKEEKTPPP